METLSKLISVLLLCLVIITGCSTSKQKLPQERPKDFGFILNYGIGAKNQLDTFKGTYTKDMIGEQPITTNLKLSDEEMDEIYSIMRDINICSYPDDFKPKSSTSTKPFNTYSIKVLFDNKEKNIYWDEDNLSVSKDAVELRNLFDKIHKIISGKEEFKVLPNPQNSYE
ncbi:hypothetical protein [Clostridium cellulovorans]|uniref:Lipoprotein n=1 Tax=Clostridium cellulovorans (strain ATCC 35296 / DSM 3052 / OCM 3 / 743B) TaxID=573061 RepID=D9SR96_CLOC7|nr:hypothetical protein [Clostridium cellulovorans]ADL52325.1 hypothetical protein Clocel_2619 [Clostridium cellulovorans 743B]